MVNINQRNCLTTRKNLGIPDCIVEVGIPSGFIIVPKGWSLNLSTDTFDKDYVNDQIQQGNFVPVLGAVEFTNGTPEPTTQEFQGGFKEVVRNGLPEFTFKYTRGGWKFASALYSYNSTQAFDILLAFRNGAIAGASNGTTLTGFDLGMLNSGTYMFTDGSNKGYVNVMMQLVDADQYNLNVAVLTPDSLDFNVNAEIFPVTDIIITGRADATDDNKLYVKFKFAMNEASLLGGVAAANLKVTTNGVANPISGAIAFDSITKEWTITTTNPVVLDDQNVVQLYDVANTVACAKIGNKYYAGTSDVILGLYD